MAIKKLCPVCMQHKPPSEFYCRIAKCKSCEKTRAAQWKKNNPARAKVHAKTWAGKNKGKGSEAAKRYRDSAKGKAMGRKYRQTDEYAEAKKRRLKRAVDALSALYIRGMMARHSSLKPNEIPEGLIEVKRLQLMIERECREKC